MSLIPRLWLYFVSLSRTNRTESRDCWRNHQSSPDKLSEPARAANRKRPIFFGRSCITSTPGTPLFMWQRRLINERLLENSSSKERGFAPEIAVGRNRLRPDAATATGNHSFASATRRQTNGQGRSRQDRCAKRRQRLDTRTLVNEGEMRSE